MPTYEYRCVSCEHQFERFQRMSDEPVKICEKCGEPVQRLLFPVAIQFKGSGFYTTDYARKNGKGSVGWPVRRKGIRLVQGGHIGYRRLLEEDSSSKRRLLCEERLYLPRATDCYPRAAEAMAGRDCELVAFDSSSPLIVLTNDDGVSSPGLAALKTALDPLGEVRVVAPDQNRSGAARSITMHTHLWVEEVALPDGSIAYSTDGTPVDCVRMAALGLLDRVPDLIVSGINLGENLGDDITYSGTVAAAFEGIVLGIPAIAISAAGYRPAYDLTVPARVARLLVSTAFSCGFPAKTLLNVNCPDRSWDQLAGVRLTTLGKRIYGDKVEYRETRGNRRGYHIYNDDLSYQKEAGCDFEAIGDGYVAVTPLHFDLMSHEAMDELSGWQAALDTWREV